MSDTELIPIEDDEADLGPHVLKMRLQGQTPAQISRELMLPKHRIHQILDYVLPTVDGAYVRHHNTSKIFLAAQRLKATTDL
jgi:hypothetical protein